MHGTPPPSISPGSTGSPPVSPASEADPVLIESIPDVPAPRVTRAWLVTVGYLLVGIVLGLLLIFGLTLTNNEASGATSAVTDDIVRLHARDIGLTCWAGASGDRPAKLTVSLEVSIDGKVQTATASGATAAMRSCVETRVRAWEFLPQAQNATMMLPIEVDRR